MKIAHITTNINGGAGIAALRLHCALLKEKNIESHVLQKQDTSIGLEKECVCTLYESTDFFYRLRRKFGLTLEKKHEKLIPTFSKNYEYEIATFPTTSYRIEEHPLLQDADIIHLHWVANFLNYPTFFKNIKKPIVWTLHDKNPFRGLFHTEIDEKNNAPKYGKLDKAIAKDKAEYLKHAKNLHIVTPSLWLMNQSLASETLSKFPHTCIANGIDIASSNIVHEEAQIKIGVNNEKKTLLFIAHSIEIPRRGFYTMKEALSQLSNELADINIISVGGNKIDLEIPSINHIHFNSTSDVELLNTIYAAADIQLLPSEEDNLPNVMLESFANGTPVISFANGGMAEHIITGENGILVGEIGVEPLRKAIHAFLSGKYIFDRNTIKEYAQSHFDEKQQALKYIDLYKEILNR